MPADPIDHANDVFSKAISVAAESVKESFNATFYESDSPLLSALVTVARLRYVESTLYQVLLDTTGVTVDHLAAGTQFLTAMIVGDQVARGDLTIETAQKLFKGPDFTALGKVVADAQKSDKDYVEALRTVEEAISYLHKKSAD